jgi:hypothetical protein
MNGSSKNPILLFSDRICFSQCGDAFFACSSATYSQRASALVYACLLCRTTLRRRGEVQDRTASDVVRGKFEAQTFKPEPVMEARMNEINRKSFSLWGTLKNHSKHAQG